MGNGLICLKGIQKGNKFIDTEGNITLIGNSVSIPKEGYFLVKIEEEGDLFVYRFVGEIIGK